MSRNKTALIKKTDHRYSLSERLGQKRDQILKAWRARMQKEMPSSWLISAASLISHVEDALDRLISANTMSAQDALQKAIDPSMGFKEEFGLDQLILGNQVLREVLFETLEEDGHLSPAERNQVLTSLDRQMLLRVAAKDPSESGHPMEAWVDLSIRAANLGAWTVDLTRKDQPVIRTGRFDEIMGIEPGKTFWTPHDWTYCVHPEDRAGVFDSVDLMMAGKRDFWDVEYRNVCQSGSFRWIKSWGKCIRDARGTPLRLCGVVADITERKKFEMEREQFIRSVVHDIKNPLTAIKLRADVMQRGPLPTEKVMNFSKVIHSNIDRVLVVLRRLSNTAWMHFGKDPKPVFERFNLRTLIESEVQELSASYGSLIQVEVNEDLQGYWSREGIRRSLQNLIDHAVRHGEPDAPVSVQAKRQGESAVISVHYSGSPIPPDVQETLFRPFENLSEPDPKGRQSLGFELVFVRGMAEAHGGKVSVKSDESTGTSFEMILPIRRLQDIAA